jgi:penicillin amidase
MRVRSVIAVAAVLAIACAIGAGLWARGRLRASLPVLEGSQRLEGLSAKVRVARDALGIPTIHGASREDVARAIGFLHAQDRFFQMDLARRRAAGELAALVGARALTADREIRAHRFRAEARAALGRMEPAWRAQIEAYTSGVNRGLETLGAPPFEYLLLGQAPQPWRAEDSLLVILSMFITLQDPDGRYESTLATMYDLLPTPVADFLASGSAEWDSPITGITLTAPPVPGPDTYDLRSRRAGRPTPVPRAPDAARIRPELETSIRGFGFTPRPSDANPWDPDADRDSALGSNNWAVAGRLTASGRALLANDMHLAIRVPNTWYRASLEWPDGTGGSHRLIGVTLPGVPAVVVGSNTHIAWGFTNSQGDWSDIVQIELDPQDASRYRTPQGWRTFERFTETIEVAGEPSHEEPVSWTTWGPVMPPDHRGRPRAFRWVAHDADRLAASIMGLESARSVDEAFDAVNGLGTPGQNFVVADASGRIGWTIYGSIPRRVGFDGRLPASWADGRLGWSGWLDRTEYPRVADPESGRIWTANARVLGGPMLAAIGDGNYEVGSRARIIRDRLAARDRFSSREFLEIQLDTSAAFLARWRDLLLQTLSRAPTSSRLHAREVVEQQWSGDASPESAAYRLTRMFRERVSEVIMAFALAECLEADPAFDYRLLRRREGPIWAMVSEKPMHLLDPQFDSWDQLLTRAADDAIERAEREGGLAEPWSRWNITVYRHPLSPALPFVGRLLDMPQRPLAGDVYTPNMHWNSSGPSERMIVSPGREAEGILHMPTGQSGHPLSPFYGNSHQAWVDGEPTPFLPGEPLHTLVLTP